MRIHPKQVRHGYGLDLQDGIEFSLLSGEPLAGLALDPSKAYNTISRLALNVAAEQVSWPAPRRAAYGRLFNGLWTYFHVGHHMSPPLLSPAGVSEGFPLAVIFLIAITWLVSAERQLNHELPMKSYVHNWAVQSKSAAVASNAVATMADTTMRLGMTMFLIKSCVYAAMQESRDMLRRLNVGDAEMPVVSDFADLGMIFCCSKANSCAKGFQPNRPRLLQNMGKFLKLQMLNWSLGKHVAFLCRVVLPATLYGCELASISTSSSRGLAGKCNKAIRGDYSQRNHYSSP